MIQYEEILDKISPVFYKFLNYRSYFKDNNELVSSYLEKINPYFVSRFYPYPEIPIVKAPTYLFLVFEFFGPRPITISLFEEYEIGISYSASYYETIVILIINNFSFENHGLNYSFPVKKYRPVTIKDLFIALVGKDTYETIRRNIR